MLRPKDVRYFRPLSAIGALLAAGACASCRPADPSASLRAGSGPTAARSSEQPAEGTDGAPLLSREELARRARAPGANTAGVPGAPHAGPDDPGAAADGSVDDEPEDDWDPNSLDDASIAGPRRHNPERLPPPFEAHFSPELAGRQAVGPAVWVDAATGEVLVACEMAIPRGKLEFLLTTPRGRAHESVLLFRGWARDLARACRMIGVGDPPAPAGGLRHFRDPRRPEGERVTAWAEFVWQGRRQRVPATDLLLDTYLQATMQDVGFVFTGSLSGHLIEGKDRLFLLGPPVPDDADDHGGSDESAGAGSGAPPGATGGLPASAPPSPPGPRPWTRPAPAPLPDAGDAAVRHPSPSGRDAGGGDEEVPADAASADAASPASTRSARPNLLPEQRRSDRAVKGRLRASGFGLRANQAQPRFRGLKPEAGRLKPESTPPSDALPPRGGSRGKPSEISYNAAFFKTRLPQSRFVINPHADWRYLRGRPEEQAKHPAVAARRNAASVRTASSPAAGPGSPAGAAPSVRSPVKHGSSQEAPHAAQLPPVGPSPLAPSALLPRALATTADAVTPRPSTRSEPAPDSIRGRTEPPPLVVAPAPLDAAPREWRALTLTIEGLLADRYGDVIATEHDPACVLNTPLFAPQSYLRYLTNHTLAPQQRGWPVLLRLTRRGADVPDHSGKQVDRNGTDLNSARPLPPGALEPTAEDLALLEDPRPSSQSAPPPDLMPPPDPYAAPDPAVAPDPAPPSPPAGRGARTHGAGG